MDSSSSSSSSSPWERAARMLAANTKADLLDLHALLTTLLTNVMEHPSDAKYRLIKLNNKAIQSRLVGRKGGVEFLQAAGFVTKTVDGIKVLVLDVDDSGPAAAAAAAASVHARVAAEAEDALAWLQTQVAACVQMAEARQARGAADTCAECIVQLRFPTGATAVGGFARTDHASDVLSFACCFYHADRADAVRLREGHSAKTSLAGADLSKTLDELGLGPRVTLVVDTLSEADRVASVCQTYVKVATDIQAQKRRAEELRLKKLARLEVTKAEREKILMSYKDDRGDQRDREAIAKGAAAAAAAAAVEEDEAARAVVAAETRGGADASSGPPDTVFSAVTVAGAGAAPAAATADVAVNGGGAEVIGGR